MTMLIPLEGCEIRSLRSYDAAAIARYANNQKVAQNLRDGFPHPYTRADALTFIDSVRDRNPETTFAIASGGEAIGTIGLTMQADIFRGTAEIGFWIGEPFWGRGYATQAVRALSGYGFQSLALRRIYAQVFGWNPASARVLTKAGYTLEGRMRSATLKFGQTTDLLHFGLLRDEWLAALASQAPKA
jgi:ribosomal-protein-alanine N-acetyltransferase